MAYAICNKHNLAFCLLLKLNTVFVHHCNSLHIFLSKQIMFMSLMQITLIGVRKWWHSMCECIYGLAVQLQMLGIH